MTRSIVGRFAVAAMLLPLAACVSLPVPQFEPSYDRVQQLKAAGAGKVSVGAFSAAPSANNKRISVRGNPVVPPKGVATFGDYVKGALEQELQRAELLSPDAPLAITGALVANDLAAGMDAGSGKLAVEVTVSHGGTAKFKKVVEAAASWESSFVGAIAIPRAAQSYPKVVDALLAQLYADPEFMAAVKSP